MSFLKRIGKNSLVYTTANFSEKALSFFLLPLYTRYLTPEDYGIVTIVMHISSFIGLFFTLSIDASVIRFYFDYKERKDELKLFWGTLLTFIGIFSFLLSTILILKGAVVLSPFLKDIPFYPYMTLGIVYITFQPFFSILLSILQVQEKSIIYGVLSVLRFVNNVMLSVYFTVGLKWGAKGILTSNAITACIFFIITFFYLRKQVTFGVIKKYFLMESFRYSLPIIPHQLASRIKMMINAIFINRLVNTSSVGLYNIGFQFGNIIDLINLGVNRAFQPLYVEAMKSDDRDKLNEIRIISLLIVFLYIMCAVIISFFAREIIFLFTTEKFYQSFLIVPIISFNFAANGIYCLFASTLFYYKNKTKYVSIITSSAVIMNIPLSFLLIRHYSYFGAAVASLLTTIYIVITVAIVGHNYTKIVWLYYRFGLAFFSSFSLSALINQPSVISYISNIFSSYFFLKFIFIKIILIVLIFFILNLILWKNYAFLLQEGIIFIKKIRK